MQLKISGVIFISSTYPFFPRSIIVSFIPRSLLTGLKLNVDAVFPGIAVPFARSGVS
jgi:hypothetical protein